MYGMHVIIFCPCHPCKRIGNHMSEINEHSAHVTPSAAPSLPHCLNFSSACSNALQTSQLQLVHYGCAVSMMVSFRLMHSEIRSYFLQARFMCYTANSNKWFWDEQQVA